MQRQNFQNSNFKVPAIELNKATPTLSNTLEQMIRQLDVVTQTVKVLDDRLTLIENKYDRLELNQKKIKTRKELNFLENFKIMSKKINQS
jgi:centriolar protein POC1